VTLGRQQGPVKVALRPIRPGARSRGPAPRDRVRRGREPGFSGGHVRTFGADHDCDGALPSSLAAGTCSSVASFAHVCCYKAS
jgi:hypothetical protein